MKTDEYYTRASYELQQKHVERIKGGVRIMMWFSFHFEMLGLKIRI